MKPTHLEDEDDDEPGFFQRHKVVLIVSVLVLGIGGWFYANHKPSKSAPKRKMDVVMVMPVIAPPPPPPPPPPPKQEEPPPPDEKEVAAEEEPPPDAPEAKPAEAAPADEPLGTAIAGGDGSGLGLGGGKGGSGMIGGHGGKSYSDRARWQGRFSRQLQALFQQDPVLKFAKGSVPIRVWLDESGRIIRVSLIGSTGDSSQDNALRQKALVGRMTEPAPPGTPMPVKLRFSAR